jgi:pimeloyl-ACP methyl ester carboxylesterase
VDTTDPTDTTDTVGTVTSADGTTIAFSRAGSGPALVLIDGAMCYGGMGPMTALAPLLRDHFTVYTYDRRGRGGSGDTQPYAVEREIEDLEALVAWAGGSAFGYGISSGAALLLRSAAAGVPWRRLALFEPAYTGPDPDYSRDLAQLLAAGRRGDAVELFMTVVGVPAPAIAGMRAGPGWPLFEAIAPTLAYDEQVLSGGRVPSDEAARVKVPTLVIDGGASPATLRDAGHQTLAGQTHDVDPTVLAPVLGEFFGKE